MIKGLDLFSKRAIAESGIGDDAEADVAEEPPVPDALEEGWLDAPDTPGAVLDERTELVDFDEAASALDDRTDVPAKPDRPDRCAPDMPLVEETTSVLTEVVALLANERPDVEVELGLVLLCEEEFCK
jgi:hypothetical protein